MNFSKYFSEYFPFLKNKSILLTNISENQFKCFDFRHLCSIDNRESDVREGSDVYIINLMPSEVNVFCDY